MMLSLHLPVAGNRRMLFELRYVTAVNVTIILYLE